MDVSEDVSNFQLDRDPLEFLDFTGVDECEKKRVLSSLQDTSSDLQLPWIITQHVPSKTKNSKGNKKQEDGTSITVSLTLSASQTGGVFTSHPFNQAQFPSVYAINPNLNPKFPVSPMPYTIPYHPAVVPMTPIYTNFHHGPPGIGNNANLVNPVLFSPEHVYTYAQVSPVPASFENHPQFSQNPQYNQNIPSTVPTPPEYSCPTSTNSQENAAVIVNNVAPEPALNENITPADISIQANPCINENSDVTNSKMQKKPVEKPTHPSPLVSYGVPSSSPFPNNKETNPPKCPSPTVDKTECGNINDKVCTNQNGVITNGHNVDNSSKNKSWASLFNKGTSERVPINLNKLPINTVQEIKDSENNYLPCPIKNPRRDPFVDPTCYRMGEYLLSHTVDGKTISLQPRGLLNRSNYCYINSILQALLACPPLYNLLSGLSKNLTSNEKRKPTPVIDSMCKLVNEFEHLPAGLRVGRRTDKNQKKEAGTSINCGIPFEPSWIYKMLNGMRSDSFLVEGRQEDAEEFFGCLLNGLNDEIQELMKLVSDDNQEELSTPCVKIEQETENWQVMGPKNKGSITRKTQFGKTPISNIFGGLLRSKLHRAGDESTNNIQPFFTLQLNIEKANTVSEALEALASKNLLEGVTSTKTNEQVEAWQQVMIEELPIVLVLHLKCFDYQLNGCTKIMKSLEFPIDLKIDTKLLSAKLNSSKEKQYKLFAVVYHDGKEASKGHYLTDAFHVGYNSWLRYDDASVKAVSEEQVLSPQGCRVPYLLFYRRSDYIRTK